MKPFKIIIMLLVITTALKAQVKFSDLKPEAGKEVSFSYDPKGTKLEKSEEIKCSAFSLFPQTYLTAGPEIKPITLIKDGAVFKGVIPTTDSTTLVALYLYSGEAKDENPDGYYIKLNQKGQERAESLISEANLFNLYGRSLGMKPDLSKAKVAFDQAFILKPALKNKWLYNYLSLNYKISKESGTQLIKENIDRLQNNKPAEEKDLSMVYELYNLIADKTGKDGAKAKLLQLYPKGSFAYSRDVTAMNSEKDIKLYEDKLNGIINKYQLNADKKTDAAKLSGLYTLATYRYAKEKNNEKFDFYASKIADKISRASAYNAFAWPLAENNENTAFAAQISKKSLDLVTAAKNDDFPASYRSKDAYLKSLDNTYGMFADTYALLLYRLGNYKEAITYEDKSFALSSNISPDMNVRYVTYLNKDGQFEKAYTVAEKLIKDGEATDSVKADFKVLYAKLGKQGDYTTYLAKLEEASYLKEKEIWLKKMIDMPAPTFSLANLQGEKVSLADLRGKTVIVDYWATWCGPCVASFPGMQKAIDKYKDNPNIVFLFINTWQREDNREQVVKEFMNGTKYTFNVLLDTKNKLDPTQFYVISQYKVEGIPTKFIIDGKGNIRFKAVGFSGSADGVVKELDMMIGLVANTNQVAKAK